MISNNQTELDLIREEMGNPHHIMLHCDVSSETEVRKAIDETISYFGKLDGIHNNAGIVTPSAMLHETSTDEWHKLMDVNLKSIYSLPNTD